MSSKRILGIAGAAMIGTLAGTGAVHATIGTADGKTTGAATFAKETLRKDAVRTVDPTASTDTTYYEVSVNTSASGELDVNIPAGISIPVSTTALIQVELENLVLGRAFGVTHLSFTSPADPPVAIAGITNTIEAGGAVGDSRVWINVTTGGTNAVATSSRLMLEFDLLGVDADNAGSITVTARRTAATNVPITRTTELSDAIKTASVFEVEATPTTQVSSVEDGFMRFKRAESSATVDRERLKASIGKLEFKVATSTSPIYNAGRGSAVRVNLDATKPGQIVSPRQLIGSAALVFTGDTSFLGEDGKVFISHSGDDAEMCGGTTNVTFEADEDDGGKLKATLSAADGGDFGDGRITTAYVCLEVDGETAIPAADPYGVAITFTSVNAANAAFPPGAFTGALGGIERDGSNVDIAYLTTNQKYNQRLVLVNRSNAAVGYSMTFRAAEGTTATARDGATGTLPALSRTVLDVRDIVTFDNGGTGGHGSAELNAVVASGMLDVATVTTTRSDGSTDTVVWDSQ